MKRYLFLVGLILSGIYACQEEKQVEGAVARVNDQFLTEGDLEGVMPANLVGEDSILHRNNAIKQWATRELLLEKARINVADERNEIEDLVKNYREELLIDRYRKALLQQELDTAITQSDIDSYYESNKNVYRLNEDLYQLSFAHFDLNIQDKKDLIKLFRSTEEEDREMLKSRELEFYGLSLNDSIWIRASEVENRLPFLKNEKRPKKNQFIQKEDSLGVYLVAVKDIRLRNEVAPKSYVVPTIKQMILHKRKLDLMNEIEKNLVIDAINNKQFEQY